MSKINKSHHKSERSEEHGNYTSYVTGFILSLLFTFIPYYLVVNKSLTSTVLLVTILGFAFVQMLIQIFFFLHLGRGPKPLYNIVFFVGTVGIILVTVGGSIFIMNNLYNSMSPAEVSRKLAEGEAIYQIDGEKTGACQQKKANHKVYVKEGVATPSYTEAKLCDTITFVSEDNYEHLIVFGIYPEKIIYAGAGESLDISTRAKSITLSESGEYHFYDEKNPNITGSFTVEK